MPVLQSPPLLARCRERSSIETIGSAQGNFRQVCDPSKDLEIGRGRVHRLVRRTVSRDKEHSFATIVENTKVACVTRTRMIGHFFAVANELEELFAAF